MNLPLEYTSSDLTSRALQSLRSQDTQVLIETLAGQHPADLALMLESVPSAQRMELLLLLPEMLLGSVVPLLQEEVRSQVIQGMDTTQLSSAVEQMTPVALADTLAELPDAVSESIMQSLDADNLSRLNAVLEFAEGSAGRLMATDVLSVRPNAKLSVVLRWLRNHSELPGYTSALMVTDKEGVYLGKLPMSTVVTGDPDATVESLMQTSSEIVRADASEQEVAQLFDQRHLVVVAVLDGSNHLLGRITVDHAMALLKKQADNTLLRSRGLNDEADLFAPILPSAKQRGFWLGINLATVFLAAWVIGQFQAALDQIVALAVLMPIVASMGGIAGSQTLTLTIRGMALNQIVKGNVRWLATKELGVGALNGIVWAVVVAIASYLWFWNSGLSVVIGVAMILNLLAAALSGVAVPLLLKRVGMDPALSGAVVLTTVTDIVGFLSFLGLASMFLL